MGRLAEALTQTLLAPFSTFWPQDWNASMSPSPSRLPEVTADSAMGVMTYYSGVRFLAETIASLPLLVYERLQPSGKQRAYDHPMYPILHDQANPEMSAFTFRETLVAHIVAWGNGYAERQVDGLGRTVALWPLRPDRMVVLRDTDPANRKSGGRMPLLYRYRLPGGEQRELPEDRVFHVRGLGYDGLVGYSPITIMRRALGLSFAAEEFARRTFENDGRPGIALTHPKTLSDTARKNLRESWDKRHQGLSNAQRTAVLEEGIAITEVGFPPKDTQFLETRKFQGTELARGLRLPPHILYDLDRSTNNNIEQQSIELVTYSLRAWFVRIEQQVNKDLIGDSRYFAEHLIDGLLRGDGLARAQKLWIERQGGALSADEWRDAENRNPLPDGAGAVYLQPLNMTPLGAVPPGATPDEVKPAVGTANPDAPVLTVVKTLGPDALRELPDPFAGLQGIGVPEPEPNGKHPVNVP